MTHRTRRRSKRTALLNGTPSTRPGRLAASHRTDTGTTVARPLSELPHGTIAEVTGSVGSITLDSDGHPATALLTGRDGNSAFCTQLRDVRHDIYQCRANNRPITVTGRVSHVTDFLVVLAVTAARPTPTSDPDPAVPTSNASSPRPGARPGPRPDRIGR